MRKSTLFAGMDEAALKDCILHSRVERYQRGQDVFALGESAENLFFVISGWIKLFRDNREGEEIIISVIGPGETFAEAAVFSQLCRYPVAAQACEESALLLVPRSLFIERIRRDSEFSLRLLSAISSRQRALVQQIEQITVRTPPQRVGAFLLHLALPITYGCARVHIPYEKYLLARRLNIKPETFSRSLRKLETVGVSASGHIIDIDSLDALRRFCEIDEEIPF
jgi:CRP-like cAMP-binding protein